MAEPSYDACLDLPDYAMLIHICAWKCGIIFCHTEKPYEAARMIHDGECPLCSARISQNARFCSKCGYQVDRTDPLVCSKCLTPVSMWNESCSKCGAPLVKPLPTLTSLTESGLGAHGVGGGGINAEEPLIPPSDVNQPSSPHEDVRKPPSRWRLPRKSQGS